MLQKSKRPCASVVNLPRRFMSAWPISRACAWFSYRPVASQCHTSTRAWATGAPAASTTCARTCMAGPGVGLRKMDAPLAVGGEFSRQNGPSRLWVESAAWFCRQTRLDTPSEPAISTTSLCESWLSWPIRAMSAVAARNSSSVSFTSFTKPCRCVTSELMISRKRGSGVWRMTAMTASVRWCGFWIIGVMG